MSKENDVFIYMDIYRCAKIARVAVDSFVQQYSDVKLCLFGVEEDFKWLRDLNFHNNLIFEDISDDKLLVKRWNIHGHFGTAHLWAHLIKSRNEKYLLHLDSDVIFRGDALGPLFAAIHRGVDLVGSPRNYVNNLNNKDDVRNLTDLVQTAIFAFNREKITEFELEVLIKMCRGHYNPLGHPVIDFFDPVMFDILNNGGKIEYLDIEDYGGTHRDGHRKNAYKELNEYFDIGNLFLHFASVGSGLKYFHDFSTRFFTPNSYINHGLERYWLFSKLFYSQDLAVKNKEKAEYFVEKYLKEMRRGVNHERVRNGIDFTSLDKKNNLQITERVTKLIKLGMEIVAKVFERLLK